jgi:iron(III) transport system substrate-binding protein
MQRSLKKIGAALLLAFAGLGTALQSHAQSAEKELVVYASIPAEIVDFVAQDFGQKFGIKVTSVKAGTGDLLNRLRAEKNRPVADVMWAGFAGGGKSAPDLFDQFKSKELPNLDPIMIDPAGYNTPYGATSMVIMYNTKLLTKEQAPKCWADLAKPEWKGKIVHADPAKSSAAYTALTLWLQLFGRDDRGWKMVEDMTRNMNIVLRSSLVFQQVGQGEYPVGVTYEEGAFKYVLAGTAAIVYPCEGTIVHPEGMFMVKGAPNPNNARKFADYLLSKEMQTLLTTRFPGRRPTVKGITTHPALLQPSQFKVIPYDEEWASKNYRNVLDRMQQVFVKTQQK